MKVVEGGGLAEENERLRSVLRRVAGWAEADTWRLKSGPGTTKDDMRSQAMTISVEIRDALGMPHLPGWSWLNGVSPPRVREKADPSIWLKGPDSEAARAAAGECNVLKLCPVCTSVVGEYGDEPECESDPAHTPAARRVVAYDGGDGLVEDIDVAYLDRAIAITSDRSESSRRMHRRMWHMSNAECDAAIALIQDRLASWLRHRDEKAGHRA